MAILSTYISQLPVIYQHRYQTQYITWANELLSHLSMKGFMPLLHVETGVIPESGEWISKPATFRKLNKCFAVFDRNYSLRVEEVNNKLRLMDVTIDAEDDPVTPTVFSGFTTSSITVNLTGKTEDEFEDYLFVVTGGTYSGYTYLLSGNDESGVSTTKLYFETALSSALDGTKVTAAYLCSPEHFVMIDYESAYDSIGALGSELNLENLYETEIVPAWLRYKAEEHSSSVSKETQYWKMRVQEIIDSIQAERLGRVTLPPKGRRLVGFEGRRRF